MPLYMDVHRKVDGLSAEAVADAHNRDLEALGKHGVKYLKYGRVWCLVDAPNEEAANTVHREAHGLVGRAHGGKRRVLAR